MELQQAPAVVVGDGQDLGVGDVAEVSRRRRRVTLSPRCRRRVLAARRMVDKVTATGGKPTYGINTGFGNLSRVRIPANDLLALQSNLLRSHAAGVSDSLETEVVRAMILLLLNSLAKGHSGVRLEMLERLVTVLNSPVTPVVPSRGSVGSSGDLAPLAHLALAVCGEGRFVRDGSVIDASVALAEIGLEPVEPRSKEGLALINGTHLMAGLGALLVHDTRLVLEVSELAAALALDVLLGSIAPMDDRIHRVRRRPRQRQVAARVRALLAGSELLASHVNCSKVQDPYSLRCIPQVLGAFWEGFDYVAGAITLELDAVTDNPLCFPDDGIVLPGGNFHGQPLSLPLDLLAVLVAEIGAFSERRTYRLLSDDSSERALPPFLIAEPGIQSGLMVLQYVAAALVAENQVLAHPAGTASLPTSAGQEDYNSLGATAALKARQIVDNTLRILAVELLCACQALDLRRPLRCGSALETVHAAVRELSAPITEDRSLADEIERVAGAISAGSFREAFAAVDGAVSE